MNVFLDGDWIAAPRGTFILIPGRTTHDFENRSAARAGILSFNNRSGFEKEMPAISQWFAEHPPGSAT